MSSLSFIPRNLAKSRNVRKQQEPSDKTVILQHLTGSLASASPLVATQSPAATQHKAPKYDDIDYANLISLSLSDYALWLDSDLRQKLRAGAQPGSNEGNGCEFSNMFCITPINKPCRFITELSLRAFCFAFKSLRKYTREGIPYKAK